MINKVLSIVKKSVMKLFDKDKLKVYVYTASNIATMLMAFAISVLLTRWLNPEIYGKYKYAVNILFTLPTYFEFGIHFCSSRIVAEDNADESHGVVPVSIGVLSALAVIITFGLYMFIFTCKSFEIYTGIEKLNDVRIIFPFIIVFASNIVVTQLYQGTGKIYRLSAYSFIQYAIVIVGVVVGHYATLQLTFEYCIFVYIISNAVVQMPVLMRIRIQRDLIIPNFKRLFHDIKSFGIKIYLSSFATSGASTLIGLICGSIYGYSEYGYYTLAISLAQFFTFISSSMATVKFKDNVKGKYLKKSDMLFMLFMNSLIYLVFSIMINKVFFWFYSPEYAKSIAYLRILAISYIFNGMALFYNRFFIARKMGNIIMRNSFMVAAVNVIASIILIPLLKINGLVIASLIASAYNFFQYIITYRSYLKNLKNGKKAVLDNE
ncbi:MAG TPA: oligosaccharide flippase family protein [Clostridiales bacterium]|nr:oligosaccharide flippase family protein [Clostridiales bacterium]